MVPGIRTWYFLLVLCLSCVSQRKAADNTGHGTRSRPVSTAGVTEQHLVAHVEYLADDKLEGRRTGSRGERLAAEYVRSAFEKEGLQAKGDDGSFFQSFKINDGKFYQARSYLIINDDSLASSAFFPFPASPSGNVKVKSSIALKEIGVPWFLDLREDLEAASGNPHFDLDEFIAKKASSLKKKGASAILAYNSDPTKPDLIYNPHDRSPSLTIPVIFVTKEVAKKYFSDETATLRLQFAVAFQDSSRVGSNVLGFINNGMPSTVVVGAHLDHLGYGEDGGSLFRPADRVIHNGADDNASGVAAIIELARLLKTSRLRRNNYLFIAFSGEELGLFGSKFFTEHPTIDLASVNYMLNLDMVGRLNKDSKTLTIGGYGTSPLWPEVFRKVKTGRDFVTRFDSSGSGPSDHTSFYRKDIPVLFFFTGIHSDYHKPSDDADKINYPGEAKIVIYIFRIIESLNRSGKIPFRKTREMQFGTTAQFSVTLGIMPDYTFDGTGVRVDGISDGRPAQKAGLEVGDIIIGLGDHSVSSLENYMQALASFKHGDSTKVKVKRRDETIEATVTF